MRRTRYLVAVTTALTLVLGLWPAAATAQTGGGDDPRFRALVFSKVTNFYHESIPAGQALIEQLGEEHDFEVVVSDDSTLFNDETLATFDVVVFNNPNSTPQSGAVLNAEQRAAFERYIQAGGGFTGIHAASAVERDWEWYEGLVGSIFTNHPPGQNPDGTIDGRIKVTDRVHPSTAGLPELWEFEEEWYNWNQRVVGDVHVLAWVDTKVGIAGLTEGPNHPHSWCQVYDGGRSWFTAGGHSPAAFGDELFAEHLLGGIEWAAGAAPGDCGATESDSFNKVRIANNPADPMALAFPSEDEVLFIQRGGAVRIIDQTTLDQTVAGEIDVYTPDSDGLLGVVLDPDFADNRWLYLAYSDPDEPQINISRFTLTTDNVLDEASEEVLLEIPTYRGLARAGVHMGGLLDVDAEGNLYAAIGDNIDPFASDAYTPIDERPGRAHFDAQSTSANTADLRGKVIRITPTDDGGYTIPEGNLFPPGEHDAEEARPEIYAMGLRNPFRFTVDKVTGNVMVGEHSSDARSDDPERGPEAHGEYNVITEAGNLGWPYCYGPNEPFVDYDFATGESGDPFDCDAPVNDSPHNTGLTELPPIVPADIWQNYGTTPEWPELGSGGIAPVGGPVYDFDPELDSDVKFPEYYDGKWFIAEWDRRWIKTVSFLSEDHVGERYDSYGAGDVYSIDPWGIDETWIRPHDLEFGPDGALYVIEWGSNFGGALRGEPNTDAGIYRVEYVAGDRPPTARAAATPTDGQAPLTVQFSSDGSGHPLGNATTLSWDFGDGSPLSSEPNPTHTYSENGTYTARLTVTDDEERTAIAVVEVVVGNTRPEVTIDLPPDGGFFSFGDTIPYEVSVTDAEDGTVGDGVECADVELQTALGHDQHAHPLESYAGCTGTVATLTDGSHGDDQNLYYVLEGVYTDGGGDGVDTLTGAGSARLRTKSTEAEHYDAASGVTPLVREGSSAGVRIGEIRPGDWIAFDPVNLRGIDSVTLGASSGGQGGVIELRRDAPDGDLLGSVQVDNTGDWAEVQELTVDLADPGDTFALYLVFAGLPGYSAGGPDLLSLDWLEFNGPGVSDTTSPVVTASAEPTSGEAPLEVAFSGSATASDGREIESYEWDFGDGTTADGPDASHTYTEPGDHLAVLTATDSEGATGSAAVAITVAAPPANEAPTCTGGLSDEFDGDALDSGRWTKIVRPDAEAYSYGDGALTLPTVAGRLYSTENNDGTNIVLQPMPEGAWEATTRVTADIGQQYQKAGLIVYGDDDNYARANIVGQTAAGGGEPSARFEFIRETAGTPRNDAAQDGSPNLPASFPDSFYLRVTSDGSQLTAAYSTDGESWTDFGRPADLAGIDDPHVGLFANKSHTAAPVVDADFDWFRITPDDGGEDPGIDDEFDGDALDGCRWDRIVRWNGDTVDVADGELVMQTTSGSNFGANNQPPVENMILQSAPEGDWLVETKVHAPVNQGFQQAGIIHYADDGDYVKIDVVADNPTTTRIELRSEIADVPQQPQQDLNPAPANEADDWWFRLGKEGSTYTAWVSTDGETWTQMPAQVANDAITDGAIGVFTMGRGQTTPTTVAFDYFRVVDDEPPVDTDAPTVDGNVLGTSTGPLEVIPGRTSLNLEGEATLTKSEDGTSVDVRVSGLQPGEDYPAHLHDGSCDDMGGHYLDDPEGPDAPPNAIFLSSTADPAGQLVANSQGVSLGDGESPWIARPTPLSVMIHQGQSPGLPMACVDFAAYDAPASLVLSADDGDGSGVAEIHWREAGATDFSVYDGPVAFSEPGDHTIEYRAADEAGNASDWSTLTFAVADDEEPEDTTAPTVTADVEVDDDSADVTLTLTADDGEDGSGVAQVHYRMAGDTDFEQYTEPVVFTEPGDYTVEFRAADNAGNASEWQSVSFVVAPPEPVDETPPTVTVDVEGDGSEEVMVTLSADDGDGSGVAEIHWRLAGATDYTVYDGPETITEPGDYTLEYRASDVAGNASEWASVEFTVAAPASECPDGVEGDTVMVGAVDTGIPNRVDDDGCSINDRLADAPVGSRTGMLRYVNDLARELMGEGLIDGRERGALTRAAVRPVTPRGR